MQIGVIGSGNMGRVLGQIWAEGGHGVFFGSRDRTKAERIAREVGHHASGGTTEEAARFGDVLLYTTRTLPNEVVSDLSLLNGKILVDLNNREIPADWRFPRPDGPSIAESIAAHAPQVRVVKAFNTAAMELYGAAPEGIRQQKFTMFLAGDDASAKATVGRLTHDLGCDWVDAGPLQHAWILEAMGDLIRYAMVQGGRGPGITYALPSAPEASAHRFGGRQEGYR